MPKSALQSFKETIESLIIAFILAFVFRAFVVEAFVIPTGSMADTLRGAHFQEICPHCGYQYNFGFNPRDYVNPRTGRPYPDGHIPPYPIGIAPSRLHSRTGIPLCPMCGCQADTTRKQKVKNGDRILVLKYLYQFQQPQTWDVVVFKNPTEPDINYIKRLIARPGETIEIIDGDIYINGTIKRKPPHVQNALWIEAFDSDYQPADLSYLAPEQRARWRQPFTHTGGPDAWRLDQHHRFEFSGAPEPSTLTFSPERLRYVCANFCAYNGPVITPDNISSDLKLALLLIPGPSTSHLSIILGKYGRTYRADFNSDGSCSITDESTGTILARGNFPPLRPGRPVQLAFANVDHSLRLTLGENSLRYDGPSDPAAWGYDPDEPRRPPPSVALNARGGPFTLEHLALYRDTHYTHGRSDINPGLGTEGHPFTCGPDEFFVLGDNSPFSLDSRFWSLPGKGNHHVQFTQGTVPREYLIGRAFFVYWPAGFSLHPKVRFNLIPNVGDMRFIY